MALDFFLYGSRLTQPLSYDALRGLLETSQRNNHRAALSGFLHIEDGIVLQYLEGPPDTLQETIDRIRRDPRHTAFVEIERGALEQRYFEDWNMALVENTTLSLRDLAETPQHEAPDVRKISADDLITLLSANASYLRQRPSIVA